MYASLTFYSITTTGDGVVSQAATNTAVGGDLQLDRRAPAKAEKNDTLLTGYIFFPLTTMVTGLAYGQKASDGTANYTVDGWDTFDDHQEIYLRKVNT